MRLDKYLADMGCGSRSELKKAIRGGEVTVNDAVVKDPGYSVPENAYVVFRNESVHYEEYVYYMLNKPSGVVSASRDPREKTVVDLIAGRKRRDLFPVGRLDKDTTGLLILTNDGALSHRLLTPGKHVDKVYRAMVEGEVTEEDVLQFAQGLVVDETLTALPAELRILASGERSIVEITIREGKYHQIKRMFHAVGKEVIFLERISMGAIRLDERLERGMYRRLTEEEVARLKGIFISEWGEEHVRRIPESN